MTGIVIGTNGTTETIPAIGGIVTENIDPTHGHALATTAITMIGTAMGVDVQTIGTETEMIATAMIGLTDAGPDMTIMTMRGAVNVAGSMMIENGLGQLTIGTGKSHPM
jgi:hypothetical protein